VDLPRGADDAVTALFAAHYPGLVRFAVLLVGDSAAAEDLAQDAFVRLHRRWRWIRDTDHALPYLRTAVLNGARSRGRRSAVERRHRPAAPPPSSSAEELALVSEEHREVLALLDRLPRRQREVIVLRYWLDLSEAEIARTLGVAPGTVKSSASRALTALSRGMGVRS
jgi:RNA polymerase sigma-70 factor (sigma-E family)